MYNFDKYINIPYLDKGRSLNGVDCWGIIWLIYKEEKNIILPDNMLYDRYWYKKEDKNYLIDGIKKYKNKIQVNYPFNKFDILFFYNRKRSFVDHAGIYIDENKFIHTYENKSSEVSRFSGYWESRLWKGFAVI